MRPGHRPGRFAFRGRAAQRTIECKVQQGRPRVAGGELQVPGERHSVRGVGQGARSDRKRCAMSRVTVIGPNLMVPGPAMHVHATGCADIRRSATYKGLGAHDFWQTRAVSLDALAADVYADQIAEAPDTTPAHYRQEFQVFPCVVWSGAGFVKDADTFAGEVRRSLAVVRGKIATRAAHPTYGNGKTDIRAALLRADTLVKAYDYLTTGSMYADNPLLYDAPFAADLRALEAAVRAL